MNLGDRFRPWHDFMVRLSGPSVDALTRTLRGRRDAVDGSVEFVANAPLRGRFDVRAALRRFAEDPRFTSYRIAMAYIDRAGVLVLERALARGADVELVIARRANVYQHSNMRSVAELLDRAPRFRAWLCPEMVHAKAIVARDASGARASFIGSANLKRNSFRMFAELDAVVTDPDFNVALDRELDRLVAGCEPASGAIRFNRWLAGIEDLLG
jgi:phosphatidylserine/phosphatidylglycerophosphate/cardiolipin synthase-like enzyme